ncbi:MAG: hypothetical protein JWN28_451 [Candidatus Saccharibacteria bacterium]|nr:hypothetical protein [Candidatus Saccharibacteria bacterium]
MNALPRIHPWGETGVIHHDQQQDHSHHRWDPDRRSDGAGFLLGGVQRPDRKHSRTVVWAVADRAHRAHRRQHRAAHQVARELERHAALGSGRSSRRHRSRLRRRSVSRLPPVGPADDGRLHPGIRSHSLGSLLAHHQGRLFSEGLKDGEDHDPGDHNGDHDQEDHPHSLSCLGRKLVTRKESCET